PAPARHSGRQGADLPRPRGLMEPYLRIQGVVGVVHVDVVSEGVGVLGDTVAVDRHPTVAAVADEADRGRAEAILGESLLMLAGARERRCRRADAGCVLGR